MPPTPRPVKPRSRSRKDNQRYVVPIPPAPIGYHITGHAPQVFFPPQTVVVVCWLPDGPLSLQNPIDITCAGRFETIHHQAQGVIFAQLDEPMGVIRHEHPGQHAGIAQQGALFETTGGRTARLEISEKTLPANRGAGHQIDMVGERCPAPPQGPMA